MSEYCYGTLAILGGFTLIVIILLKLSPHGYEDDDGYHEGRR